MMKMMVMARREKPERPMYPFPQKWLALNVVTKLLKKVSHWVQSYSTL